MVSKTWKNAGSLLEIPSEGFLERSFAIRVDHILSDRSAFANASHIETDLLHDTE